MTGRRGRRGGGDVRHRPGRQFKERDIVGRGRSTGVGHRPDLRLVLDRHEGRQSPVPVGPPPRLPRVERVDLTEPDPPKLLVPPHRGRVHPVEWGTAKVMAPLDARTTKPRGPLDEGFGSQMPDGDVVAGEHGWEASWGRAAARRDPAAQRQIRSSFRASLSVIHDVNRLCVMTHYRHQRDSGRMIRGSRKVCPATPSSAPMVDWIIMSTRLRHSSRSGVEITMLT
jgi:hypothetical protein